MSYIHTECKDLKKTGRKSLHAQYIKVPMLLKDLRVLTGQYSTFTSPRDQRSKTHRGTPVKAKVMQELLSRIWHLTTLNARKYRIEKRNPIMPGVDKMVKHKLKSERVIDHFVDIRHFMINNQPTNQCSRYY